VDLVDVVDLVDLVDETDCRVTPALGDSFLAMTGFWVARLELPWEVVYGSVF